MKKNCLILVLLASIFYACGNQKEKEKGNERSNIVLIVADDLGFSDLGCFGSEIETPNIDALAKQGQIFTNFYTAATCSPSRAMMLTGTDNHIAGFGNMAEQIPYFPQQSGQPGYEGYLNTRVISIAQLLKDAGYHTYLAGKWHLGLTPDQSPTAKGFERCFSLMDASSNHFYPDESKNVFWEDGHYTQYPDGAYSSDVYTDKMIGYIQEDQDDNRPFFLYAAYTSPHWPLQAPKDFIEKYQGRYDIGYDSLRSLRFQGLKDKEIVAHDIMLPQLPAVKGNLYSISANPLLPWKSLDKNEQRLESRKMEIYSGMVNNMDYNIGRLIDYLKQIGEYDNTLFVFLSDNGPDVFELNETPDPVDPYPYMGTSNSFIAYGPQWAHASSAVNRLYKGYSSEGGIHSPMIVKMPFQQESNGMVTAFSTIMDLAPTFLELAGGTHPTFFLGDSIAPYKGRSLLPLLNKERNYIHDQAYVMGWELFGRGAIRKGKWKISKIEPPFGKGEFELFDLEKDPTESTDLSGEFPEKYSEMLSHWKAYVKDNGVILLDE
ncbi:MAG: arylsulfatase [Cyclobacteriaceae bacterium]